jgi:N-acetyl-gamma-glutamyl-phosphate reductase
MKKIGVAIIGGTGFGAGELLRLFINHPDVQVLSVVSQSGAEKSIADVHPNLRGFYNQSFAGTLDFGLFSAAQSKFIFVALPHGSSSAYIESIAAEANKNKIKVIDLSGDLRLKDEAIHKEFYPDSNLTPKLRESAVYGCPELFKELISTAAIIANPGCLATAAILALAPLAKLECEPRVIVNLNTGSSGSGRALKESTNHPLRHANMFAYKMLAHQHEPEVKQALKNISAWEPELSLVAHSLPISRGIFGTIYARLKKADAPEIIQEFFSKYYGSSPFVRVLPYGASPQISNVSASNFCEIGISLRANELVILVAIDNLIKGMAGQAIQNMNIMAGIAETAGLNTPSLRIL